MASEKATKSAHRFPLYFPFLSLSAKLLYPNDFLPSTYIITIRDPNSSIELARLPGYFTTGAAGNKTFSQAISSFPSRALSGLSRAGQQNGERQGWEWQTFAIRWEKPVQYTLHTLLSNKKAGNPSEKKNCASAGHFCSILLCAAARQCQ